MINRLFALALTALIALPGCSSAQNADIDENRKPWLGLVPRPVSQKFAETGAFVIDARTHITVSGNDDQSREIAEYFGRHITTREHYFLFIPLSTGRAIEFRTADTGLPAEGYRLTVSEDSITVEAADRAGLFYGAQTLLQMMPAGAFRKDAPLSFEDSAHAIACQTIEDYPYLPYRGMMLDVARTLSDKQTVMRFIDRLARHKINRFHWHLVDDEGWRIEIKSHPELAQMGGFRGGDSPVQPIYGEWDKRYGGYFTQDEVREIVAYASFRNIEVIPEIDLPGHSRAIAKVHPSILCGVSSDTPTAPGDRRNVWCASKESNYELLAEIFAEICDLFPSKYIHVGGDEVFDSQWRGCAECKKLMLKKGYTKTKELTDHFVERMTGILRAHGRTACVWDEASESGTMDKGNLVYGWQNVPAVLAAAKKGYKTVVMPGTYFYLDQNPSPDEDGINWGGIIDTRKVYSFGFPDLGFDSTVMRDIAGVEGTFFSELLLSHTPDYLDYQVYPRLCALAEVGWTHPEGRGWDSFYSRLAKYHLDRLGAMEVKYRQFPPEATFRDGIITAMSPFPATPDFPVAEIRYTTDGTDPDAGSPLYTDPISDSEPAKYRFRTFFGGVGSYPVEPRAIGRITLAPGQSATVQLPLTGVVTANGLWYLRARATDGNIRISKIYVTAGGKQSNIVGYSHKINQFNTMRFYADDSNRQGTICATVRNDNKFDCDFWLEMWKSPYIEPAVTFSSSQKENPKYPFGNLTDYNPATYFRTANMLKKGDTFTFTFASPVDAESIEVHTGLSYLPRYLVAIGRVQVSYDGKTFSDAATLSYGKAIILPEQSVKAVRIVADEAYYTDNAVAIQDLKITPRK